MISKVRIDPSFCVGLAFLLMALPYRWSAAILVAAIIHEAGHMIAVRAFGGHVYGIRIGLGGALIEGEDLGPWRNALCSLAGPILGAVPALAARWFPRLAVCAVAASAFNLLPVQPLDGGRALAHIGERFSTVRRMCRGAEVFTCIFAVTFAFLMRSMLPMIALLPYAREKYLAMRGRKGYNSATIEMR